VKVHGASMCLNDTYAKFVCEADGADSDGSHWSDRRSDGDHSTRGMSTEMAMSPT
jgi:hypothetical protein